MPRTDANRDFLTIRCILTVGLVRIFDRVGAIARLDDVTPHTLRHTFASVAGDLGFSELTIAALLGHAARGVTQRYVHIDDPLKLAADRVAAEISDLLDGRATAQRAAAGRPDRSMRRVEVFGPDPIWRPRLWGGFPRRWR